MARCADAGTRTSRQADTPASAHGLGFSSERRATVLWRQWPPQVPRTCGVSKGKLSRGTDSAHVRPGNPVSVTPLPLQPAPRIGCRARTPKRCRTLQREGPAREGFSPGLALRGFRRRAAGVPLRADGVRSEGSLPSGSVGGCRTAPQPHPWPRPPRPSSPVSESVVEVTAGECVRPRSGRSGQADGQGRRRGRLRRVCQAGGHPNQFTVPLSEV